MSDRNSYIFEQAARIQKLKKKNKKLKQEIRVLRAKQGCYCSHSWWTSPTTYTSTTSGGHVYSYSSGDNAMRPFKDVSDA